VLVSNVLRGLSHVLAHMGDQPSCRVFLDALTSWERSERSECLIAWSLSMIEPICRCQDLRYLRSSVLCLGISHGLRSRKQSAGSLSFTAVIRDDDHSVHRDADHRSRPADLSQDDDRLVADAVLFDDHTQLFR